MLSVDHGLQVQITIILLRLSFFFFGGGGVVGGCGGEDLQTLSGKKFERVKEREGMFKPFCRNNFTIWPSYM